MTHVGSHSFVQVKYMTRGATWSPSYDLRVDTMTDSVSCTYYGMVTQSTTEDWKGTTHSGTYVQSPTRHMLCNIAIITWEENA